MSRRSEGLIRAVLCGQDPRKSIEVSLSRREAAESNFSEADIVKLVGSKPNKFTSEPGGGFDADYSRTPMKRPPREITRSPANGEINLADGRLVVGVPSERDDPDDSDDQMMYFSYGRYPGHKVATVADLQKAWASNDWHEAD